MQILVSIAPSDIKIDVASDVKVKYEKYSLYVGMPQQTKIKKYIYFFKYEDMIEK